MRQPLQGMWRMWPGTGWPATQNDESALINGLVQVGGQRRPRQSGVDRDDVTILMNALRCNVSVETLLRVAPGVKPISIVIAHEKLTRALDAAQRDAIAMLNHLEADPGQAEHMLAAGSVLLPVPANRLKVSLLLESHQWHSNTRARICDLVERTQGHVDSVEVWLDEHGHTSSGTAATVGSLLYHPNQECLWSSPFFLPTRVGQLTSRRLANLLGERE